MWENGAKHRYQHHQKNQHHLCTDGNIGNIVPINRIPNIYCVNCQKDRVGERERKTRLTIMSIQTCLRFTTHHWIIWYTFAYLFFFTHSGNVYWWCFFLCCSFFRCLLARNGRISVNFVLASIGNAFRVYTHLFAFWVNALMARSLCFYWLRQQLQNFGTDLNQVDINTMGFGSQFPSKNFSTLQARWNSSNNRFENETVIRDVIPRRNVIPNTKTKFVVIAIKLHKVNLKYI